MSFAITWEEVLWGGLIFVVTFTVSLVIVACVMVQLPCTYFCELHPPAIPGVQRHPALRWTGLILKNLLGIVLIGVGIVLSLPGVPGQGLLTILMGVMLVNFPGKRRLERKIVSRPKVLASINRLRSRFGRPPLVLDPTPTTMLRPEDAMSSTP